MKRKGKIKYADPVEGYGYVVAEDASEPAEAIPFKAEDVTPEMEELVPGTEVVFEVDETGAVARARNVEMA